MPQGVDFIIPQEVAFNILHVGSMPLKHIGTYLELTFLGHPIWIDLCFG